MKFTATNIAKLPPSPTAYADELAKGLQLLVRAESRTWRLRYKFRKVASIVTLGHYSPDGSGMSLAQARALVIELRADMDRGIDPKHSGKLKRQHVAHVSAGAAAAGESAAHSIETLAYTYADNVVKNHKLPGDAMRYIEKDILPAWKGRDARSITFAEVRALCDAKVAAGSPVAARRLAIIIGSMFKEGMYREIVTSNPVAFPRNKWPGHAGKERERVLSDAELAALVSNPRAIVLYHKTAHVIMALLLTGQRRGELARAKWADVDLKRGTWRIPDENAKGGKGHLLPLSDWAVEQFRALKGLSKGSQWVLPNVAGTGHQNGDTLSQRLIRCKKRFRAAGIGQFGLHDLRRTFKTNLRRLGVDPHTARKLMSHAPTKLEITYDPLERWEESPAKRDAMNRWAAHLMSLSTEKKKAA